MKNVDFSSLYVLAGKPLPLTDAAAFTSYVTKNNVIGHHRAGGHAACRRLHRVHRGPTAADPPRPTGPGSAASLVFGAGLAAAPVTLAGDVLAGGAALDTFSKPDPVVVRAHRGLPGRVRRHRLPHQPMARRSA